MGESPKATRVATEQSLFKRSNQCKMMRGELKVKGDTKTLFEDRLEVNVHVTKCMMFKAPIAS